MNRNRSIYVSPFQSRQDQFFTAVVAYGFLAPRVLAVEEGHDRMLDERMITRHLAAATSIATRRPLMDVVRRRLGEMLVLIGRKIQGTHPVDSGVPSQVAASAGSRL